MDISIPTRPRTGIIFRPGEYGAKGTYTDADLDAMAGDVNVPIKMSHHPTLLEGKLGTCHRAFVGFDEAGKKVLMGEWSEPEPLALLLGDRQRGVSVELGMEDKKLKAVALEVNPHITDAAFFSRSVEQAYACFSRGESVAQFRYESEAERDAIPAEDFGDPDNKLFPVRTQAELRSAMEELCNADDPTAVKARIVEIAARKGLKIEASCWYSSQGMSQPLGTDSFGCFSQEKPMSEETKKPSIMDRVRAIFAEATPEEIAQAEAAAVTARTGKSPREIELEAQLAQFTRSEEQKQIDGIAAQAEASFAALVKDNRAVPGEREGYVAAFSAALLADAQSDARKNVACFSAQPEFSLAKFMADTLAKLPQHTLTKEQAGGVTPEQIAAFEQGKTTTKDTKNETVDVNEVNAVRSQYKIEPMKA